jgi:hydrogenase expression/formation protein HypD
MKYIDEYRDEGVARGVAAKIAAEADPSRHYAFMEFCGGHTHAIARYGIEDMLPSNVRMIHGPGCPVCVLPTGRIDHAIAIAGQPDVILCTYGDLMRVPGSRRNSLSKAKAGGADIRMVYSAADCLRIAAEHPDKHIVFFAIGFETTTPPTALVIKQAQARQLSNFSVFCNHVLTPSAIVAILESQDDTVPLDGFVGPAHVSTVIGSRPYAFCAEKYGKAVVISGFEPLDVLQSILMLIRQVNDGRVAVENEFIRAVSRDGNLRAIAVMDEVFMVRPSFEWRGLGEIPDSALMLRPEFAEFDAERRFAIVTQPVADAKSCECAQILRGVKHPADCKVFGTACTPETPIGACMVSAEGACAAHWTYGRFRNPAARDETQHGG